MPCVVYLGDFIVNLVVCLVNLVPVVVDVDFPVGHAVGEKGLVGLLKLLRISCIYPSSVRPFLVWRKGFRLEEGFCICVGGKVVGFLGGSVEVIDNRMSDVSVPPSDREGYEVNPPKVGSPLGVYAHVGVSVSRVVLGEGRWDEDRAVHC